MSFAETLAERTKLRQKAAENKKYAEEQKNTEKLLQSLIALIKSSCIAAADSGNSSLTGYIAKKWRGNGYHSAVSYFPKGETFYKAIGHSEYYTIESFGSDKNYVEYLCDNLTEVLKELGFKDSRIAAELRMFKKEEIHQPLFSKRIKYRLVDDSEKYVIFLDIKW